MTYIEKFGAAAVFGRALSTRELRRLAVVDNIVNAYRARARADNWSAWTQANPAAAHLLNAALKAAEHGE